MENNVQILLSTYNGEKYLKQQIDSILNQTYTHWQLLIKDDGSTDNTQNIITEFCAKHPEKIKQVFIKDGGSSTKSFMAMLPLVTAQYAMFADQDDFWLAEKLALLIKKIKDITPINKKCLVFSDLQVVDSNLKVLYPSFMAQHKLNANWAQNPNFVFVQSMAAGCTMLFTKELLDNLPKIDLNLFQHDHWLLMCAANNGVVGYIPQPLVLYRQHNHNAVGAHGTDFGYFLKKIKGLEVIVRRWRFIQKSFRPKPNIWKMLINKIWLNLQRL